MPINDGRREEQGAELELNSMHDSKLFVAS